MERMDSKKKYINRLLENSITRALDRNKSVLLLGARQTGKTTLINRLVADFTVSFVQPTIRQRYEQQPGLLLGEIEALAEQLNTKPLVVIDEIQKIPEILNVVQDLIDRDIAKFILTGSSARKLYSGSKINLLPGRVVSLKLDPLTYLEIAKINNKIAAAVNLNTSLKELLLYGTLPGVFTVLDSNDKEIDLSSYVTTYLEEEIRAEAVVRNVGFFSRFLHLAASESGNIVNFRKLSQEIGVAHTTIASYYQILEDCLIAERIDPLIKSQTRRKLIKTPKYLFFDLGIRRVSALEGIKLPETYLGKLFEQFVGLELVRLARANNIDHKVKIHFWRDVNGQEVDWVIVKDDLLIPIEVKLTDKPNLSDIKHLKLFKEEYNNVINAYVVCQTLRKVKLSDGIYAISWQEIAELIL